MRISDWSSDVCSSDLQSVAERVADEPALMPFDRRDVDVGQHLRHRALAAVRVERTQAAPAEHQRSGDESGDEKRAHILRSEEHTAELQSLMRISYAVFCLIKIM